MCVYAHISAWVCTHVHVIAHACRWTLHSPDPIEMWIDSLVITCLFIYYIYSLNIYFIYILNQLGSITVKMADKIVVMTIKILSLNKNVEFHEKYTIDNVAAWRKNERLVVLRHYLHVPKHTHTHPNTDLNAHIWKYQYIYIFQTSNCIEKQKRHP